MKLHDMFRYFRNNVPKVSIQFKKPLLKITRIISKPTDAVELLRSHSNPNSNELKEHVWVILLSLTNKVIGISTVNVGKFNSVQVNKREIAQLGLLSNAAKVIVAHNHTSDICSPSKNDLSNTQKLKEALSLFEIDLMDHIIITADSFYSFNSDGKINYKKD
jgi:DNA repair protein RadC